MSIWNVFSIVAFGFVETVCGYERGADIILAVVLFVGDSDYCGKVP